jgi:hypothetical protein
MVRMVIIVIRAWATTPARGITDGILTANTCVPPKVVPRPAPLSVDDIAAGMLEALTNDSLRETKVAHGLQRVKNFSWEKCASEVLALFEALVHPASRWQETPVVAAVLRPAAREHCHGMISKRRTCVTVVAEPAARPSEGHAEQASQQVAEDQ